MSRLSTCPQCAGFLPHSAEHCPHCATTLSKNAPSLAAKVLMAVVGGAFATTLSACYGPAPVPDGGTDVQNTDTQVQDVNGTDTQVQDVNGTDTQVQDVTSGG